MKINNELAIEDILKYLYTSERKNSILLYNNREIVESEINDFLNQPAELICLDLNMSPTTVLHKAEIEERTGAPQISKYDWINRYSAAIVIKKLKEVIDKQYELIKSQEETIDKLETEVAWNEYDKLRSQRLSSQRK